MRTWTTTCTVDAAPTALLDVLTDPDACRRWAPVSFDVDGLATPRLSAGTHARVTGRLAGCPVGFDLHVDEASDGRLALRASGAVVGRGDDLCCARPAPALLRKEDGGSPARTTIAPRASPPRRPARRHPRDRPRPERLARSASVP